MRLVVLMLDTEAVFARIHVFVDSDLVPNDVDVPLYLRLLQTGWMREVI